MFDLSILDILIIIAIGLSVLNGIRLGFTTEALKLVSYAGAIFITVMAHPMAVRMVSEFLTVEILANIVAMAVVFGLALLGLNFLAKFIGERIRSSFIGPVDRGLGAVFGFFRGAVVVSAAYLAFSSFVPEKSHPEWVTEGRLLPYVKIGAVVIADITPDIFDKASDLAFGYDDDERSDMDELVEDVSGE